MTITTNDVSVRAMHAKITDDTLIVELEDGRTITTPLAWYPRLMHGTKRERGHFELGAFGIHWPDLDEDLSISGMLAGRMSGESPASFQRWLDRRGARKSAAVRRK